MLFNFDPLIYVSSVDLKKKKDEFMGILLVVYIVETNVYYKTYFSFLYS